METLAKHAIEGYTGSAGYMPPKGGRLDLSDDEVASAVEYMANESS
jgi:cytochrome c